MKHMKFLSFFLGIAFAIIACSSNNETIPAPEVDPDGDDGTTEVKFAKGADRVGHRIRIQRLQLL